MRSTVRSNKHLPCWLLGISVQNRLMLAFTKSSFLSSCTEPPPCPAPPGAHTTLARPTSGWGTTALDCRLQVL